MRLVPRLAMVGAVLMLAGGCASLTTTPIQSMSKSDISVAYVNGFAGMGDARKVAMEHCGDRQAEVVSRQPMMGEGPAIDQTVVQFSCK